MAVSRTTAASHTGRQSRPCPVRTTPCGNATAQPRRQHAGHWQTAPAQADTLQRTPGLQRGQRAMAVDSLGLRKAHPGALTLTAVQPRRPRIGQWQMAAKHTGRLVAAYARPAWGAAGHGVACVSGPKDSAARCLARCPTASSARRPAADGDGTRCSTCQACVGAAGYGSGCQGRRNQAPPHTA